MAFPFIPSRRQLPSQVNARDSPFYSRPQPAAPSLAGLVCGAAVLLPGQGRRVTMPPQGRCIHRQLSKSDEKVQCREQGLEIGKAFVGVIAGLRNANIHSLVTLDFSLFFDKAIPRKYQAVSIFRQKSIGCWFFSSSNAEQLHLPAITMGAAYSQHLFPNLGVGSYQNTIFSSTVMHRIPLAAAAALVRCHIHCVFPPPSPPRPQLFQWGFWLFHMYMRSV